jgi:hypothetical protein
MEDPMTETSAAPGNSAPGTAPAEPTGWAGWVYFAGLMMILLGSFQVIEGLVALFNSQFYVVRPNGLVLSFDYSSWGWWHLIIGAITLLAGLGVLVGNTAARVIGVVLALISAIAHLLFLAAYPLWGAIVITINVIVIYALIVHGRELKTG